MSQPLVPPANTSEAKRFRAASWRLKPGAMPPRLLTESGKSCGWQGRAWRALAIAVKLSLSEAIVQNYLSEAISKLGAANRVGAARIARTKG